VLPAHLQRFDALLGLVAEAAIVECDNECAPEAGKPAGREESNDGSGTNHRAAAPGQQPVPVRRVPRILRQRVGV